MNLEFSVQPSTSNKAIRSLYTELLEHGDLNLRPSYQRNAVWSDEQKSYLMKSIMDGCPMPLFLMYTFGDTNECVDGQNRLTAIKEYIEQTHPTPDHPEYPFPWKIGEDGCEQEYVFYPISEAETHKAMQEWLLSQNKLRSNQHKSRTFRFMNANEKKWFHGYQVAIQFITTEMSFEKRKEIFRRWQMGSPIGACDRIKNDGYPFCEFVLEQKLESTLYESIRFVLKPRLAKQERSNWLWDVYRVLNVFFQPQDESAASIIISSLKCGTLIKKEDLEKFEMSKWLDAVQEANEFLETIGSIPALNKSMKITMVLTLAHLWKKGTRALFAHPDFITRVEQSLVEHPHSTLNNENQSRQYLVQFSTVCDLLLA